MTDNAEGFIAEMYGPIRRLLTASDIIHLNPPDRYFHYAEAYRSASALLCQKAESDATFNTWSHSAVVLMLAAHAVELFLKGALLKRGVKFEEVGHDLNTLAEKYRATFPDPPFAFECEIPFASPVSESELIKQRKQSEPNLDEAEYRKFLRTLPEPSILYRYPVNKRRKEWPGLYGFIPSTFLVVLIDLPLISWTRGYATAALASYSAGDLYPRVECRRCRL